MREVSTYLHSLICRKQMNCHIAFLSRIDLFFWMMHELLALFPTWESFLNIWIISWVHNPSIKDVLHVYLKAFTPSLSLQAETLRSNYSDIYFPSKRSLFFFCLAFLSYFLLLLCPFVLPCFYRSAVYLTSFPFILCCLVVMVNCVRGFQSIVCVCDYASWADASIQSNVSTRTARSNGVGEIGGV